MILHCPELFPTGKRIDSFVQHIDLVPTISDLLGLKYQPEEYDGQNLLPLIQQKVDSIREHVFIEESYVQKKSALRTQKYKYITARENDGWCNYCQKVHVGKEELYDLENDPGENQDITQPVYFAEASDGVRGLPSERTSNYPDRAVIKTKNGIVIYIDDSENSKTIRITHPGGAHINIDNGGNVQIKGTSVHLNP